MSRSDRLREVFTYIVGIGDKVRAGLCTADGLSVFCMGRGGDFDDEILSVQVTSYLESGRLLGGAISEAIVRFETGMLYFLPINEDKEFYAYLWTTKEVPSEEYYMIAVQNALPGIRKALGVT